MRYFCDYSYINTQLGSPFSIVIDREESKIMIINKQNNKDIPKTIQTKINFV